MAARGAAGSSGLRVDLDAVVVLHGGERVVESVQQPTPIFVCRGGSGAFRVVLQAIPEGAGLAPEAAPAATNVHPVVGQTVLRRS